MAKQSKKKPRKKEAKASATKKDGCVSKPPENTLKVALKMVAKFFNDNAAKLFQWLGYGRDQQALDCDQNGSNSETASLETLLEQTGYGRDQQALDCDQNGSNSETASLENVNHVVAVNMPTATRLENPALPQGLFNLLSTSCYMNASLQFLLPILPEIRYLESFPEDYVVPDYVISLERILANLQNGVEVPEKYLKNFQRAFAVRICKFSSKEQQCASEFLRKLLSIPLFETKRFTLPVIYENTTCPDCGQEREGKEACDYLTVCTLPESQIPGGMIGLTDILDEILVNRLTCQHGMHALSEEEVAEIGFWPTSYTGQGEFGVLPRLILLELQKDPKNPIEILLTEYLMINGIVYEIMSIVLHDGPSPKSGHYRSLAKHNATWFEFDDLVTKKIDFQRDIFNYRWSVRAVALRQK